MFYEEIIRKFNNAGVRYAIVCGVAVNLHGHIRMTADLDIVLELEDNNLAKAVPIFFKTKNPEEDPSGFG